jgi:hypothetical protein
MAKPERLEDLGRIRVMLEQLCDESEALEAGSFHDEYFAEYYSDESHLDDLFRSLRYLSERVSECIVIARGHDDDSSTLF